MIYIGLMALNGVLLRLVQRQEIQTVYVIIFL